VAAELNFSRAAQRVHVVQSALPVAVARLEKELGVALFDRSKRHILRVVNCPLGADSRGL
jgi:DNA-binding transcriptional LysR family regulator